MRNSIQVQLPLDTKMHNVFHVSLLKAYHAQLPQRPPPIWEEGEDVFEVERIIRHRTVRRQLQFLVLWKRYPLTDATWEPVRHLLNAKDVVQEYVQEKGMPMPSGFEDETCSPPPGSSCYELGLVSHNRVGLVANV